MTGDPSDTPEQVSVAAEHALGLLSGEELRKARELAHTDAGYRKELARWRGRLAALHDEVDPISPPPALWRRIEAQTVGAGGAANDNVRQKLLLWRSATGLFAAIAAALALVLVLEPRVSEEPPVSVTQTKAPPMVAMLGDNGTMKVVASWDPTARQLVLAVPGEMPTDAAHSHELWVIPAGGKPRSLGLMPDRKRMHMQLANALATLLEQGATIAISVEPRGGSPSGAPTGAVVASGALNPA